jgi:uncharacterized RDD family membrane protein YckC
MNKVGIGTRVLNFLLDTFIVFWLAYAAYKAGRFYAFFYGFPFFAYAYYFFATIFVYSFFFESVFQRTPAKWLSMTKVVNRSGGRPGILQVFIRSLVRVIPVDCFFIPFLDKPLHDALSKTEVVEV